MSIAEEHKSIMIFSLPWGGFCYKVLQMGLCPSCDKFNMESDDATRGKEGCLKGVDDVLMQAQSYRQMKDRLIGLFNDFRDQNIKVKSTKFRLGEEVKF